MSGVSREEHAGVGRRRAVDPAALVVERAPPLLTVQDEGRARGRAVGIPRSGAMDLAALAAVNQLVGNAAGAAALEWAGGGGRLVVRRPLVLALGGALTDATLAGSAVPWGEPVRARPGDVLDIGRLTHGRWAYIGIAGGIATPLVLGARATYLPAGLGGLDGRALRSGDVIPLSLDTGAVPDDRRASSIRDRMMATLERGTVGVIATELAAELPDVWATLCEQPFTVHGASDRMGTRLIAADPSRLTLPVKRAAGRSTPSVVGLIQLPPDGHPIILMPDGPTLGGYPALGVVGSVDVGAVAQRGVGASLWFTVVEHAPPR